MAAWSSFRFLILVGTVGLLQGCSSQEAQHIEQVLKVKPGLWKTITTARVAPDDPLMRAMPTEGEICVGQDGRGFIPYVEDNGDECSLVDLRKTKVGWAGRSTCRTPQGAPLQIYGWLRGDLDNEYFVVGRIGQNGMVSDITAKWSGLCAPGTPVGPDAGAAFG